LAISLSSFLRGIGLQNATDRSKQLEISVSDSATTNTKTTLVASQTADRTITLPDSNFDFNTTITETSTSTLSNKTIDGDDNTIQDLALGSLKLNLTDADKFLVRDGSGEVVSNTKNVPTGDVVGTSDTQILSSKSIDADTNTITNIENSDIKSGADIARNKLASGTASHVLINDGSGVMSSESTLAKVRGGSGQDNSSLNFPASGTLATLAGTEQFTNKDYDGGVAANTRRLTIPQDTKANLDALTRKEGTLVYANDEDALYIDDGTVLVVVGSSSEPSDIELALDSGNGLGSSGTATRRFSNTNKNTLGAHATYTDSATNGMDVTVATGGRWAVSYSDSGTGNPNIGISVNATASTSIATMTYAQGKRISQCCTSSNIGSCCVILNLSPGDIVRAHTDAPGGSFNNANNNTIFSMSYLGS
jgi:hypothetical protein